jgi:hypothetical protein
MKNNLRSIRILVTILTLTVIASAQQNLGGGRLAGTWDAAISLYNCETGVADPSFQSTANFHKGGTFTGITSGTPPARRTPELGIWRHEIGNIYKFRFKAYLFDPAGTAVAYQIITHRLELSNDDVSYVSDGDAKIFAMNGMQIGLGCSRGVGTRLTLD